MTESPITWETKTVRIQSTPHPWDGTYESYLELLDFVPHVKLHFTEIETYPAKQYLEVYNDLEKQWLNVPAGHWLVKGLKGEFYPCEPGAMEMKYKIVDPVLTIDQLQKGMSALPDSYDDPRIDNVCRILNNILNLAGNNDAISMKQIEQIVADSTEFPEFWDEDRDW